MNAEYLESIAKRLPAPGGADAIRESSSLEAVKHKAHRGHRINRIPPMTPMGRPAQRRVVVA